MKGGKKANPFNQNFAQPQESIEEVKQEGAKAPIRG
jgi:hypothetical protein